MCNNNNLCNCFSGNNWWWIIILILLFCNCSGSNCATPYGGNWNNCDNNNCGCC